MTQANLNEVQSRLSHYARLVKAGETIVLCEGNIPFAEIRPLPAMSPRVPATKKRELGLLRGWFPVPDDFNAPDPELEQALENTPVFSHPL